MKALARVAQPVTRPSRRERERAFRTRLILEAAEEVFAARGFQGASIDEIARRAEIAIPTLYKLFGSKEAIFVGLVDYRQDQLVREAEAFARHGGTPQQQLERLVESIFRYFDRHRDAFRVYLSATQGFAWNIRSSLGEKSVAKYRELVAFFADLLAAGVRAGAWPAGHDAERLAVAAMGAMNGLLTKRYAGGPQVELEDEMRYATALVAAMVRSGTTVEGPAARRGGRA
jgi:AcrR family transcriptional regulator